jgi:HPt (histidine-containing phosphotransfer) domain-containing protein
VHNALDQFEEGAMIEPTSRRGSVLDTASIERLIETCGDGGEEIVAALLGTLLGDAPLLLAQLRRAVAEGDHDEARRAAHTLKSHGLTFGALSLADVAREAERLAREGDLDAVKALLDELASEYEAAREGLEDLRCRLLDGSRCRTL